MPPPKRKAAFDDRTFGPLAKGAQKLQNKYDEYIPPPSKKYKQRELPNEEKREDNVTVVLQDGLKKVICREAVEMMKTIVGSIETINGGEDGYEDLSLNEKDAIWDTLNSDDITINLTYYYYNTLSDVIDACQMKATGLSINVRSYGAPPKTYQTWLNNLNRNPNYTFEVLQAVLYLNAAVICNDIVHNLQCSEDCLGMFEKLLFMSGGERRVVPAKLIRESPWHAAQKKPLSKTLMHLTLTTLRYNVCGQEGGITPGARKYIARVEFFAEGSGEHAIRANAFEGCSALETIGFPNGVVKIEENAFKNCTSLVTVPIPASVTEVAANAFVGCTSREAPFTIPEGTTEWLNTSWDKCRPSIKNILTSVIMPKSVTSIGEYAFHGCSTLRTINIPDGVTTIGDSAFFECTALTAIIIPDNVTTIEQQTFGRCALKAIKIPESVTNIEDCAFLECTALETFIIPDGVTNITGSVFEGCTALTKIKIPESVTDIQDYAFSKCSSLVTFTIPDGVTIIPASVFEGCTALETINMPDSVETIGVCAFTRCVSLKAIEIPDGVTIIPENVFEGCTALETINIPKGVTAIESKAFKGCSALVAIELPDSVETIHEYAFFDCTALETLTIPEDSVKSIGVYAFLRCVSLETFIIPDGVTNITGSVFEGCTALTEIEIPDSVETIEEWAFDGCTALTDIEIPDSVETIGELAFDGCTALVEIVITRGSTAVDMHMPKDLGIDPRKVIKFPYLTEEDAEVTFKKWGY